MSPHHPLRLRLRSPGLPPEEHRLAGPVVELGRPDLGERPDIELRSPPGVVPAASRRHARLLREGTGWVLFDLGSTNGTWLNGQRLTPGQPRPVQPGDHLRLGETVIDILPEAVAPPRADPAPAATAPPHQPRPPLPWWRVARAGLGTFAAALLLVAVVPDWRARALALPALWHGEWSPEACAAWPSPCRGAAETRLRGQLAETEALAATLRTALTRLQPVLAQQNDRRAALQREDAAIAAQAPRQFLSGGAMPVSVAADEARRLDLREELRRQEARMAETSGLQAQLTARLRDAERLAAEAREQLALLPVGDALRAAERLVPAAVQAQSALSRLRQDGTRQRDAAASLLRSTEDMLARR